MAEKRTRKRDSPRGTPATAGRQIRKSQLPGRSTRAAVDPGLCTPDSSHPRRLSHRLGVNSNGMLTSVQIATSRPPVAPSVKSFDLPGRYNPQSGRQPSKVAAARTDRSDNAGFREITTERERLAGTCAIDLHEASDRSRHGQAFKAHVKVETPTRRSPARGSTTARDRKP